MKKSTWIALTFFLLMGAAAFPYTVLAVTTWQGDVYVKTPVGDISSGPVVNLTNNSGKSTDCTYSIGLWSDDQGDIVRWSTQKNWPAFGETNTVISNDWDPWPPTQSGTFAIYYLQIQNCSGEDGFIPGERDETFYITQAQAAQNTSTLVIASMGAMLWQEVAANILTILSIVAVVGFVFFTMNMLSRVWKK